MVKILWNFNTILINFISTYPNLIAYYFQSYNELITIFDHKLICFNFYRFYFLQFFLFQIKTIENFKNLFQQKRQ